MACMAALSLPAAARPGDLDTRFNPDGAGSFPGTVLTTFPGDWSYVSKVALQSDRKIVVAGAVDINLGLTRHRPDGSLDPSFGAGGRVRLSLNTPVTVKGLSVQPDGRILVAGAANGHFLVLRFLPGGALDPSFGEAGITFPGAPDIFGFASQMVLLSDGKILVGGGSNVPGGDHQARIWRLLPNGSIDSAFGTDGAAIFTGPAATDMAVQPDGKIVISGSILIDTTLRTWLRRCHANGTPDPSFGTAGLVVHEPPEGTGRSEPSALTVQSDGKIVVTGATAMAQEDDHAFMLLRFNPDGSPDSTFNGNGMVLTNFTPASPLDASYDAARAVSVQPDGKLVVTGGLATGGFALVRYLTDGKLDDGFGENGLVKVRPQNGPAGLTAMQLQPDGAILMGGASASFSQDATIPRMALARCINRDAPPGVTVEWPAGAVLKYGRTVDAGTVVKGDLTPLETTVTLRNDTGIPLTGLSATFAGIQANRFSLTSVPAPSLDSGESTTLTVRVQPVFELGVLDAALVIATADPDIPEFVSIVQCSTVPATATLALFEGATPVDANSSVDFGESLPGLSLTKTLIIRNTGNIPLELLGITLGAVGTPNDFNAGIPETMIISAGGSTTFPVAFTPSAIGPAVRTARLRIASTDTFNLPLEINLAGTLASGIAAWRLTHFGSSLDAGSGAGLSDPDQDGIPNLLEYATAADPLKPGAPAGELVKNGDTLEYTVTRPSAAAELIYSVEWSGALNGAPWSEITAAPEVLNDDGIKERVMFRVPAGEHRRFLRLRVTFAPAEHAP